MSERAIEWLTEHQDEAIAAPSFSEFCKTLDAKGDRLASLYSTYRWLPAYWETLHERGFVLYHALRIPKARAYTDLFDSAIITKTVTRPKYKGSYAVQRDGSPIPQGYVYCNQSRIEPSISGHYGGTRSIDKTRNVRQHFGGTFHHCYVRPTFELPTFPSGKHFELQPAQSLECISREDGVLITANDGRSIGSTWVALLDEGDSLESLLSAEDQAFLRAERKAELEAFGKVSA